MYLWWNLVVCLEKILYNLNLRKSEMIKKYQGDIEMRKIKIYIFLVRILDPQIHK